MMWIFQLGVVVTVLCQSNSSLLQSSRASTHMCSPVSVPQTGGELGPSDVPWKFAAWQQNLV